MFEIIISAIGVLILTVLSVYTVVKGRTAINVTFCILCVLLASVEIADQLFLRENILSPEFQRGRLLLESLMPVILLSFSIAYSRQSPVKALSTALWILFGLAFIFPAAVLFIPLQGFYFAPDLQTERMLFLGSAGYWFYLGIMLYCVVTMVNIEAVLRSSSGIDRWKIKFEVIGLISIMAVLIFYFSQGLLYRTINMNLVPMRSGVFAIAALLIGYSKIFRGNGIKIVISRYVLYRSLTLLTVGFYLFFLGLIGVGMKYFGDSFSKDLTLFISFVSGMILLLILLSERLRRRVKVLVNKHLFAHKYDYREEWLKFSENIGFCRTVEEVQDMILTTFRKTFDLRGASLYLADKNGRNYHLAANESMPDSVKEVQLSQGLLSYFSNQGRVFNPHDGEYVPTTEEALFSQEVGAHGIVPFVENGEIEGFVVLGEQLSRAPFIYEDYDLMKTFARQATLAIVNFRLSEELAETREIAAVAKVSAFVAHDLKNLTYSLALLLENAKEYIRETAFQDDMIETVKNAVVKMKNLQQKLKAIPDKNTLNIELADIDLVVKETFEDIRKYRKWLNLKYQGLSAMSMIDREEIKSVIDNLLLNAIDAAGEHAVIRIETGVNGHDNYIIVEDNGCGITSEFLSSHLFKPFRTTKKKGLGIGLYQCRQIVEAHNGRIEVQSEPGK